jgi:hypothetical protein
VEVPPFAAAYAGRGIPDPGAVSSVAGIALRAIEAFHPAVAAPAVEQVRVSADPGLGELDAHVTVTAVDGTVHALAGNGSTRHWTAVEVAEHCARRLGPQGDALPEAVRSHLGEGPLDGLFALWRGLR